jgi:hypothetical protein
MKTFIPAIGPSNSSICGPTARLLVAIGLLGASACSAAGVEDTDLVAEAGETDEADAITTSEQPLFGSDACKSVDIRVLNSRSYPITVRSLEYYNASEGRWQSEDLTNKVVDPTAMEFWTPNFEYSENDWIYSFNVIYDHGSQSGLSYHVNTPDQTCIPGRVFLLEIK